MKTYLIQSTDNQFYATLGQSKNDAFNNISSSFKELKFKKSSVIISAVHFDYVQSAIKDYHTFNRIETEKQQRASEMREITYKMMSKVVSDENDAKINTPYI